LLHAGPPVHVVRQAVLRKPSICSLERFACQKHIHQASVKVDH
jgi:hypothetical protein